MADDYDMPKGELMKGKKGVVTGEIGSASCRERVQISVVDGSLIEHSGLLIITHTIK